MRLSVHPGTRVRIPPTPCKKGTTFVVPSDSVQKKDHFCGSFFVLYYSFLYLFFSRQVKQMTPSFQDAFILP